MTLEEIEIFLDVVAEGSFAAAARRRDLDPSSVSRAIASLEARLDARLFERTTRRLALTEAGAAFHERVAAVPGELSAAAEAARDRSQGRPDDPTGVLRVTASVAFGAVVLTPLLPALRARFPRLSYEFELTDAVLDLVAHRVDLAVRHGPERPSEGVSTRLAEVAYRVVATPAYLETAGAPSDPAELAERDCPRLALGAHRALWRFHPAQGTARPEDALAVPVAGSATLSNPLALREAARAGLGPALLADWLVAEDLASGALIDLFPDWRVGVGETGAALWAAYPSRRYTPTKVRVFLDALRAALKARRA